MLYHDFKCRFNSPTINLNIPQEDFPYFVTNLNDYLSFEIIQKSTNEKYPVGIFDIPKNKNMKPISIEFIHYKTFNEAKKIWDERKSRINFNNIRIIFDITSRPDIGEDVVKEFSKIPYKKILLSNDSYKYDDVFKINFFNR